MSNWTVATESAVDTSFFWGYLITQIPGGFLASFYPANKVFGFAIVTSAFLNMWVPGAMNLENVTILLIIRMTQGLVEVIDHRSLTKAFYYLNVTHNVHRDSRIHHVMAFGDFGLRQWNDLAWLR